jgi:hypothetical protein
MRREETVCELNVLAQFKKYEDPANKGFITEDGIRKALQAEGFSEEDITEYAREFMALDSDGDSKITFLDLYEAMMTKIPDEWLEWIHTKFALSFFLHFLMPSSASVLLMVSLIRRSSK